MVLRIKMGYGNSEAWKKKAFTARSQIDSEIEL